MQVHISRKRSSGSLIKAGCYRPCVQKADVTSRAVVEIISKTSEYLQPNPATRAKLTMLSTVSKIRGQVKSPGYPQSEGLLGECMTKYGQDMGKNTSFGENAGEELLLITETEACSNVQCVFLYSRWGSCGLWGVHVEVGRGQRFSGHRCEAELHRPTADYC